MKQAFSNAWISSGQPRKQRKYRHNAPLHISAKFLSAHLSKDLRTKHSTRSLRVRKGDTVSVLRGQHKGKSGKIDHVSIKYGKVYITGIELIRKDGTKSMIPFEPSNIQITALEAGDKKRLSSKAGSASKDVQSTKETQEIKNDKTTS